MSNIDTNSEIRNLEQVKYIVKRSENPHPFVICFIILLSILIIYCLYVTTIKKSISGNWLSSDNKIHKIKHNKWKDTLFVNGNHGILNGNLIVIYEGETMQIGALVSDVIYWVEGTKWTKQ